MTASAIAKPVAKPVIELPAKALRIAARFAERRIRDGIGYVQLKPGEGFQVVALGATKVRAVRITWTGMIERPLAVPAAEVLRAFRRHPNAEHAVLAEADGLLTLRLYSKECTVTQQVTWKQGDPMGLPEIKPADFMDGLKFQAGLVAKSLLEMGTGNVRLQPFSQGLIIEANGDDWSARGFVAGVASSETDK